MFHFRHWYKKISISCFLWYTVLENQGPSYHSPGDDGLKLFRLALLTALILTVCTIRAHGIIVVDAGHGGADGGAVAENGTIESPINLAIARKTAKLFHFLGQEVLETRTGEDILYPEECRTVRQRKVYDTKQRTALVNDLPEAVLLSIHQNILPDSPSTHGAIVFYNTEEGSVALAGQVQSALNETVNGSNKKESKKISKDIYLMNHVSHPAILVECGFLSNEKEVTLLQTEDYQKRLSVAIVAGFLHKEVPQ